MPASFRRTVVSRPLPQGLSRSALAAVGAASLAGIALAGCGAKSALEDPTRAPVEAAADAGAGPSRPDSGRAALPDAASPVDRADGGSDAGEDGGSSIALYGAAPFPIEPRDAGSLGEGDAGEDAGAILNMYGAPPPA